MPWAANCTIREATEFFIAGTLPANLMSRDLNSLPFVFGDKITLVWPRRPESPIDLPSLAIAESDRLRELLLQVAASPTAPSPITAFCRFLTPTQLEAASSMDRADPIGEAALGLIYAEAFLESGGEITPDVLAPFAAKRTLSYVGARQISLGSSEESLRRLAETWARLNSIVGDTISADIGYLVEGPLQVLRLISQNDSSGARADSPLWPLTAFCRAIVEGNDSERDQLWDELSSSNVKFREFRDLAKLDREKRLLAIERLLQETAQSRTDRSFVYDFISGYLVSQIGPGTMAHLQVLGTQLLQRAAAALWYGFFAGLQSKGRMARANSFAGQKILREVNRPANLLSPPEADIQLTELEQAFATSGSLSSLRTGRAFLEIELSPFVEGAFRVRDGKERDARRQAGLFDERERGADRSQPSPDTEAALHELRRAFERLEKSLGSESGNRPQEPEYQRPVRRRK